MGLNLEDLDSSIESCSACGQCIGACPVYAQSGLETDAPRGKLRIALGLLQGGIQPLEAVDTIARCMLCGRCARACPQALPLQEIFFAARRFIGPQLPAWHKRLIWSLTRLPKVWDFCQPPLHLIQKFHSAGLPQMAFSPYARREHDQGDVLLFGGCLSRRFFPELIGASVKALEACGYAVIWDAGLVCCGRPQAMQGRDIAAATRKNLQALLKYRFELLTSPCPGCLATITNLWPKLDNLKSGEKDACRAIAAKSVDINLLLTLSGARGGCEPVFWHSPCLLTGEAQAAAKRLAGDVDEGTPGPSCCGEPLKLLREKQPKSASRLEDLLKPARSPLPSRFKKAALSQASGAAMIATACPGCMLALGGPIPVRHVVQLYAQGLR